MLFQGPRLRTSSSLSSELKASARALKLRCECRNRCWDVGPVSGGGSEGDGLSEFLQFVDELADAVFG